MEFVFCEDAEKKKTFECLPQQGWLIKQSQRYFAFISFFFVHFTF